MSKVTAMTETATPRTQCDHEWSVGEYFTGLQVCWMCGAARATPGHRPVKMHRRTCYDCGRFMSVRDDHIEFEFIIDGFIHYDGNGPTPDWVWVTCPAHRPDDALPAELPSEYQERKWPSHEQYPARSDENSRVTAAENPGPMIETDGSGDIPDISKE